VLPLDRFAVTGGRLTFEHLAAKHGFTAEPQYQVEWAVFDNTAHTETPIAGAADLQVPNSRADFVKARIRGGEAKKFVDVYLRLRGGRREVVGIERHW
jgi:hypothetical protein